MIHKIKALYDGGKGLSIRQISKELNISRNTVKKYLRLTETEIAKKQDNRERSKHLDNWRTYIVHLLQSYPRLSAHKIYLKLRDQLPELDISERTVRRYASGLKQQITAKQKRYYEPVIDMVAGVQCQVDGGELNNVLIAGTERKIYFLVFVLSYSRFMHVALSDKPINTNNFIRMHNEAFCCFGGMPQECVYDQTKLVVIKEIFREINYNQQFYQYASTIGLNIHVCKGYDPESKGKVEAGVKYVKNNFFYGEEFASLEDLQQQLSNWLINTANQRIHGATKHIPAEVYDLEEKQQMRPYLSWLPPGTDELRKADKTGLISYQSNKYSVPMAYQRCNVFIVAEAGQLIIGDLDTGEVIARHIIHGGKGKIIKNSNHYRDYSLEMKTNEQEIQNMIGFDLGISLCALIKKSLPKIYRDQLAGVKKILKSTTKNEKILKKLVQKPRLTACMLKDYLEAYQEDIDRFDQVFAQIKSMPVLQQYAVGGLYVNI
jgi:transposase